MEQAGDLLVEDAGGETPRRAPVALPIEHFLHNLRESRLISEGELDTFLSEQEEFVSHDTSAMIEALVGKGLLNNYQSSRLRAGQTFGLVLGNYRVVDILGTGGMGVVYRAEHIHMKRVVALKVLAGDDDRNSIFLQRFYSEMQALAVLRHPNIVLAFDAGEVDIPHAPGKVLRYLVMEYVTGHDLEQLVLDKGPMSIVTACEYVRQAAEGLRHAHEHGLVHRDIKPSNFLVTPEGQVKILDFGLARLCRRRCTEAFTMLGTVDYMAPEQARDARSADIRADIYGLGGTLYWLLTGQKPFPGDERPVVEELLARQYEAPLPMRQHRPEIPLDLEAIVCQMMAQDPNDRYPTPLAVITALNCFLESSEVRGSLLPAHGAMSSAGTLPTMSRAATVADSRPADRNSQHHHILVVSDDFGCYDDCRVILENNGLTCSEAQSTDEVLKQLSDSPCDAVLIDLELGCDGRVTNAEFADKPPLASRFAALEICRRIRAESSLVQPKLVLLTPAGTERGIDGLDDQIDEQVAKSATWGQLLARIRNIIHLKEMENQAERLAAHLLTTNHQLEQALKLRDVEFHQHQDVLVFALAGMTELRGQETSTHLLRMQGYVRVLAEEAMRLPAFADRVDSGFVRMIQRCVLLHDIGKVAIPDHVLLKPGRLDAEERSIMESHTALAAELIDAIAQQYGASQPFLDMARSIARHHHERYDGKGYPDGLAGEAIPLAARITTVVDVYDALRSRLVYKPGLAHTTARRLILESSEGQFDPNLIVAFRKCESEFEQVFEETPD